MKAILFLYRYRSCLSSFQRTSTVGGRVPRADGDGGEQGHGQVQHHPEGARKGHL